MKARKRFQELNRPLTKEEDAELGKSIEADGVIEPLILMRGTDYLVDGYNRWRWCKKLKIEPPVKLIEFADEDAAEEWAIRKQLARRNLSEQDFRLFLGRLYNATKPSGKPGSDTVSAPELAEEYDVSEKTVRRSGKLAEAYDALPKSAKQLRDTTDKLTDKHVIALAKLPEEQAVEYTQQIRKGQATADELLTKKGRKDGPYFKRQALAEIERAMRSVAELGREKPDKGRKTEAIDRLKDAWNEVKGWHVA